MWNDPIVEEVRKIRNEHAKKFNYDLKAIAADLKRQQKPASGSLSRSSPKSRPCCQGQSSKRRNTRTVRLITHRPVRSLIRNHVHRVGLYWIQPGVHG